MKKWNKKSIIVSWMLSYIMILLIPLLANSYTYVKTSNMFRDMVIEKSIYDTVDIQQKTDEVIASMNKTGLIVAYYNSIRELFYTDADVKKKNIIINDIMRYLGALRETDFMMENIYIYFSKEDTVISSEGKASSKNFFNEKFSNSAYSYDFWLKSLKTDEIKTLSFPGEGISADAKSIATVRNIYNGDDGNFISIVVTVDVLMMNKWIFNESTDTESYRIILTNNNEIILTSWTQNMDMSAEDINQWKLLPDINKINFNKEECYALLSESKNNGFRYAYIIPESTLKRRADKVSSLTYAGLIISLLAGSFFIYFFLKRNYQPVGKLIKNLNENKVEGRMVEASDNEFEMIEKAFDNIKNHYTNEKEKQEAILRRIRLVNLLEGRGGIEYAENMPDIESDFDKEKFIVVLFCFIDTKNLFGEAQESGDDDSLAICILNNILNDLFDGETDGTTVNVDKCTVCILNMNGEDEELLNTVKERSTQAINIMRDTFNVEVKAAISDVHKDVADISVGYKEVKRVLEEFLLESDDENILFYKELRYKIRTREKTSCSISDIKEYVNENYQDQQMNVSLVARHFGISVSHISGMFMKETGGGLLEYINNYRVEKSLLYLMEDMDIESVALKVGFSNTKTFTRAFKKVYDLTPGKFKEQKMKNTDPDGNE